MKTKMLMRLSPIGLAVIVGVLAIAAGQGLPRRPATQAFMRQKMAYSQGILEGLALEKFDLVSKNALRMRNMSQSNHWFTMRNPEYMTQTTNFQSSITALYTAGVERKLDDATAAYMRVANNCVECHRVVRLEQRRKAMQAEK